jgi:glutamyl-tRNA synthetase
VTRAVGCRWWSQGSGSRHRRPATCTSGAPAPRCSTGSTPELTEVIFEYLRWLGIDWDEGPYFQSERRQRHREAVEQLLAGGHAYLCDAQNNEVAGTELQDGLAVRFRMPAGRTVTFADVIRGEVSFQTDDMEDFVIWRKSGSAMFLLANAVDDADTGITHAIRGEDLLSGAPKVILLLGALGLEAPVYAHLPLLVNEARKKLSKRRDDVSVADYRARGYLPEAMVNYLALLGWGPSDGVEIRPIAEIVARFRLEDVNRAAAFFDQRKLEHFNGEYIRQLDVDELVRRTRPWVVEDAPWPPERFDPEVYRQMVPHIREKLRVLSDAPRYVDFLFLADPPVDEESWAKAMAAPGVPALVAEVREALATCEWDVDTVRDLTFGAGEALGVGRSKTQLPIRVAITGRTVGPPLFEPMVLLGRDEVLRRLGSAQARLQGR